MRQQSQVFGGSVKGQLAAGVDAQSRAPQVLIFCVKPKTFPVPWRSQSIQNAHFIFWEL